jgi:TrpR family transcriptional regulator, trp operon repressor
MDEEGWWKWIELLVAVQRTEEMDEMLHLFLTESEREAIADRYQLVKELIRGEKSQRQIADDLGLSISKVTMGSKAVRIISSPLRRTLEVRMGHANPLSETGDSR